MYNLKKKKYTQDDSKLKSKFWKINHFYLDKIILIIKRKKKKKYRKLKKERLEVPFLAGGVPDLSLDALVFNNESPRLKLNADCGFWVQAELVPSEPSQYLRFSHRRVADQHHLEHVVYLLARIAVPSSTSTARHFRLFLFLSLELLASFSL